MVQLHRSDSELVAVGLLLVFFDFPYDTGGENLVPPPEIILRSDSANDWGQIEYTLDAATYFSITQWTKLVRCQYLVPCPHPTVIYSIRNAGKVSPSSAAGSLAPQKRHASSVSWIAQYLPAVNYSGSDPTRGSSTSNSTWE